MMICIVCVCVYTWIHVCMCFYKYVGSQEIKKDEYPRAGCTLDGLQKLRPYFVQDGSGTVTAGNASGVHFFPCSS